MADHTSDHTKDPKDRNGRVARSRDAVQRAMMRLAKEKPTALQASPIAVLLGDHEAEIRAALSSGWSAGAIARVLADEHVEFAVESLRLRISAMFGANATRPTTRKSQTKSQVDGAQSGATTRRPAHTEPIAVRGNPLIPRITPTAPAPVSKPMPFTHAGMMEDQT